jgi:UDP-N-acetyl-2-amino-2-deoxyglucuronate dehydrogenase
METPTAPFGFIVIGCGYFGRKRIAAIRESGPDLELRGVVDVDAARAEAAGREFDVPYATSVGQLTTVVAADAAVVAVPNAFHADAAIAAVAAGLNVLCEKPLATDPEAAARIVAAGKRYGKTVKTGSNHRFFPTVEKAYTMVNDGAIGRLLLFKGNIGNDGSHTAGSWFRNSTLSGGGTFIDNGCHLIDLSRMFMGDFETCTAAMDTAYWKESAVEDVGTAIYSTADGRQAVLSASWVQWTGYLSIELWGTDGYILIDSRNGDTLTFGKRGGKPEVIDFTGSPKDSYRRELLYFRDCVRSGMRPSPDAADGYRVIQMIAAAYEASATRRSIAMPGIGKTDRTDKPAPSRIRP